jgi:hypothetical protein
MWEVSLIGFLLVSLGLSSISTLIGLLSSWYWGTSLGIKQPGREADHSPPSNAKVLFIHSTVCLHGVLLD